MKPMTKQEYIKWIKLPMDDKSILDCRRADDLVKKETLKSLDKWLKANVKDADMRKIFYNICRVFYGSAEIDGFLTKKKLYPTWVER